MILRKKQCTVCATPFETYKATRIYCGDGCRYQRHRERHPVRTRPRIRDGKVTLCKHCGRKFLSWDKQANQFCSRRCSALEREKTLAPTRRKPIPSWTCKNCGAAFQRRRGKNDPMYCGDRCKMDALQKTRITLTCKYCGTSFETTAMNHRAKFCSQRCWVESKGKRIRTAELKARLKESGREEKCEQCGYDKVKKILHVHHKDRNMTHNALENLEFLCPNCHAIEHRVRTRHP